MFSSFNKVQIKSIELKNEITTHQDKINTLNQHIAHNEQTQKQCGSVVFIRFKDVLNAKKRKIRELQRLVATNGKSTTMVKEADGSETEMSATDGEETELDD